MSKRTVYVLTTPSLNCNVAFESDVNSLLDKLIQGYELTENDFKVIVIRDCLISNGMDDLDTPFYIEDDGTLNYEDCMDFMNILHSDNSSNISINSIRSLR